MLLCDFLRSKPATRVSYRGAYSSAIPKYTWNFKDKIYLQHAIDDQVFMYNLYLFFLQFIDLCLIGCFSWLSAISYSMKHDWFFWSDTRR